MLPSSSSSHSTIRVEPSPNARSAGYKSYSIQQLFTAATGSRKRLKVENHGPYSSHTFPAPLVLPGDELAYDPKYPPQSFKSWLNEEVRNVVTNDRRTVYIATPPKIASSFRDLPLEWDIAKSENIEGLSCHLNMEKQANRELQGKSFTAKPAFTEILNYLQAFFHGMPVRQLPFDQEFLAWTTHQKPTPGKKNWWNRGIINLRSTQTNINTQIRVRCLDEAESRSPYSFQLNLNDLLDHAMAILPSDAYCLLLLMDHDLYEDERDNFCCGRAYGGSRIAVVSSAQYQPALDSWHGLSLREGHFWPGSHCNDFITNKGEGESPTYLNPTRLGKRRRAPNKPKAASGPRSTVSGDDIVDSAKAPFSSTDEVDMLASPMQAAFHCHVKHLSKSRFSRNDLESIYLRRVTLTAAHELLHCFGLDHCVYRACAMQGTASILEDSRQPPYLCCVCENKLARAIADGTTLSASTQDQDSSAQGWWEAQEIIGWKRARQEQLLKFCERQDVSGFAFGPMTAWIQGYLDVLKTISTRTD